MIVEPLALRGAALLRGERTSDQRGSFTRIVDLCSFDAHGLEAEVAQVSSAANPRRGTLRGLHYQVSPDEEAKTVWCSAGEIFDVLVDLRPQEKTYGSWIAVNLSPANPTALHIPSGVAHGYQTLEADTVVNYLISAPFAPQSARALLWRDPVLGIPWPLPVSVMSSRDSSAPPWPPS